MLSLLTLKSQRPEAKYVLWSRIDQKSCFKSILTANLIPIIIDPVKVDDELQTNIEGFKEQIEKLGSKNIVCLISTTSCFAPRSCDDVESLAELSKKFSIPHIINNAYGLQSTYLTHQIEQCHRTGRNVDLVIQSTDKNLMVPVGGCILLGFNEKLINDVAKNYAGRASGSQSLDVFMTLLHLGRDGYMKMVKERKESFEYLRDKLSSVAIKHGERMLVSKKNPISLAMTLENFGENVTMIGSMLFTRCVSGARIVPMNETKKIDGHEFLNWGSHHSNNAIPYITAAAAIGIHRSEIDGFLDKLDKILLKIKNNGS